MLECLDDASFIKGGCYAAFAKPHHNKPTIYSAINGIIQNDKV